MSELQTHARTSCLGSFEQVLVEEFSPATASVLGLPWDHHERCRASLEADYLQPIYLHARSVARESAAAALVQHDGGTCQACLVLMSAILSWDFRCAALSRVPAMGWVIVLKHEWHICVGVHVMEFIW